MSSVTLYRVSGLALMLGAVLLAIATLLGFVFTPDSALWFVTIGLWTSGFVLLLLGLPGIAARQAKQSGWIGFVGVLLTFGGGFLIASFNAVTNFIINPWLDVHASTVENQGLYSANPALPVYNSVMGTLLVIGLVLLGIGTMRAGVLPRQAGLFLIASLVVIVVAGVISLTGLGTVATVLTYVAGALLLLGFGWMGYALYTTKGEAATQPALAS